MKTAELVMTIRETRLLRRESVAEGTMAFYFAKPPGFRHVAGQSLLMSLVNPAETDGKSNSRTFTIASAPHEPELMIATRMRDTPFKRALQTAPMGTPVMIDGPYGEMTLHEDPARPAVCLAGGIGITPFLAMARHATYMRLPNRLYLFYSNRRPEDAAFLSELQDLEDTNPKFRMIATMAEPEKSIDSWWGETGFIGREMLERYLPGTATSVYYLAGPPSMTMAMLQLLGSMGVARKEIRYEEFYGY
jgi:ferredoxin-NADP reductase